MIPLRIGLAVALAAGGALIATLKTLSHRQLCSLISYAAGILFAVTCLDLAPEAAEHLGWGAALLGGLSGYALFAVVSRFVAHVCPACAASHTETFFQRITLLMILAFSIHSIVDGVALAASASQSGAGVGSALATAVLAHKLPEGLALTTVALGGGWSRLQAVALTVLVESITTAAGAWLSVAAGLSESAFWIGWVLAHIGGGFLFLAIHATVSELKSHPRSTIVAVTLGAGTLFLVQWLVGHGPALQ